MTLKQYAALVEEKLNELVPEEAQRTPSSGEIPWLLNNAMRYSLTAGGKRLRPSMLLAAADMLGVDRAEAMIPACALEMIHTYSLIHDDLPGMDNDSMRRGRPTNHVVFGEGQAILAGDGLLSLAFELMLENAMAYPAKAANHNAAAYEIALGAGVRGMVGGQCMDLYCERENIRDEKMLGYIHENKTARMLISPLRAAGRLAGLAEDSEEMQALTGYGVNFGLLFQAVDDILDVVGDQALVGKTLGKDAESGKLTFVTLYGLDGAREKANELKQRAQSHLSVFGEKGRFFETLLSDMADRAF
ncbi:MAG: polyprenyl synthetase family protein [Clostridia bacterium]|nr:polyprenyl synthetase family protein [Clostridia bacterium]